MSLPGIELALGTAQFGMRYGIAGRGTRVPAREVQQIFARAWELGIRMIDTAPVYGDIEARFDALTKDYPFAVVSKIPPIPNKMSQGAVEEHVSESIYKMRGHLGARLKTILFHHSDDLLNEWGDTAWQAAVQSIDNTSIRLGASCYSPHEMNILRARHPIAVVQLPGNALDQRLNAEVSLDNIELHLRSVFLQGVLLLSPEEVSMKLPQAMTTIITWRAWCEERQLTPLQAALGIAKGLPHVQYCVVGVDRLSQLEEIVEAWASVIALKAPELATEHLNIIDPRYWYSHTAGCLL